jgi:hypothetical protein
MVACGECSYGCPDSPVERTYIGSPDLGLRYRTGWDGSIGVHGPEPQSERFDAPFLSGCNLWAVTYSSNYCDPLGWSNVDWFGEVGVSDFCKAGQHPLGKAFDLTAVYMTGTGPFIDTNWSWRPEAGLYNQRQYVGLVASLRRYFGTVLTAWYWPDTSHQNHIHFDSGITIEPITSSLVSDTTLVQAACNYLNGATIAVDGSWGAATEAAYQSLLTTLRCQCLDPKGSLNDMWIFLDLIARTGGSGSDAGQYFQHSC